MDNGANGEPSPSALRRVVVESGREQDVVITQHPKMEEKLALEPLFNNKDATLKPAVRSQSFNLSSYIFMSHNIINKIVTNIEIKHCIFL